MDADKILEAIEEEQEFIRKFRNWAQDRVLDPNPPFGREYWEFEILIRESQLVTIQRILDKINN